MSAMPVRPILYLDVDGPLLPFGATREELPDGYPSYGNGFGNPLVTRLDPPLGPRLEALGCELVWATTWESEANDLLAPILGFGRLPVVTWPDTSDEVLPRGVHWKTAALVAWAGGRPFAWFDDEISDSDRLWVEAQQLAPTCLIRVDHRVGLIDADFAAIEKWRATL